MRRKQLIRRTVLVSGLIFVIGVVVIASVDASDASRQGAATAVALLIGAYVMRQRKRWQAEA